jgi:NPCBM/NEW2 domain
MKTMLLLALGLLLVVAPVGASAAPAEGDLDLMYLADMQPLDTNSVQGRQTRTLLVRAEMDGTLYESSLGLRAPRAIPVYATYGLGRKYARFQARIGLPDNIPTRSRLSYELEADGQSIYKSPIIRAGDRSILVDLDVSSVQKLTLRGRALDATGGYLLVWADAKLLPPGAAPPPAAPPPAGDTAAAGPAASRDATWTLETRDVEAFAAALKRGIDAHAGGAAGTVVLAEFRGIDLASATAPRAFAEELSTALIRQRVHLVERGRLETALREMKLAPDAGLEPASAKELGRRAGAALLIVGSLADRGATVVANARVLRAATGAALWAERAELRKAR